MGKARVRQQAMAESKDMEHAWEQMRAFVRAYQVTVLELRLYLVAGPILLFIHASSRKESNGICVALGSGWTGVLSELPAKHRVLHAVVISL